MKITVITPNYNGEKYIERSIRSVVSQRASGIDLEYIICDGGSKDRSLEIIDRYRKEIDLVISEPDKGAPDAINKGLSKAKGDLICWLNADDIYYPGVLKRVLDIMTANPDKALCFGHCPIIDKDDVEIRKGIFFQIVNPYEYRTVKLEDNRVQSILDELE